MRIAPIATHGFLNVIFRFELLKVNYPMMSNIFFGLVAQERMKSEQRKLQKQLLNSFICLELLLQYWARMKPVQVILHGARAMNFFFKFLQKKILKPLKKFLQVEQIKVRRKLSLLVHIALQQLDVTIDKVVLN